MRQPIEESPKDGTAIILEDDANGTYDVAHWSTETGEWVGESGEPTKVTPSHWYPMPRDQYLLREDAISRNQSREGRARRLAASSIAVTLVAGVLIGTYFSAEVAAYVTRYAGHKDTRITEQESRLANQDSRKSNLVAQRQVEAERASAPAEAQQAAQVQQIAGVSASEAQQSLKEDRAEGWAQEPTEARRAIEGLDEQVRAESAQSAGSLEDEREKTAALAREATVRQELTASTAQHRHAIDEERARSAALASELAGTQREIETRAAQSQKAADEAVQQKQAAETTVAELRQSLQQEQKKTASLMQEAKAAQATMTAAEPQRRALDEAQARAAALASELAGTQRKIETRAAQSQKAVDEAVQQKQAAEAAVAELRQSLQQERARTEAMARDLATLQRTLNGRVAVERSADSRVIQVTQAVKTAVAERPKAAEAQGNAEAAKLIARASALLGQGNIGAARIVLERASESGNAQASFMLAEAYDPAILSAWGTYGTRGEVVKAREYYVKAHTGGIREAKDRLDALRQ